MKILTRRARRTAVVGAVGAALFVGPLALPAGAAGRSAFSRLSTFSVSANAGSGSAEIVAAADNGRTLLYTDAGAGLLGFVDVRDPSNPAAAGSVAVGGSPTSVAVQGRYALGAGRRHARPGRRDLRAACRTVGGRGGRVPLDRAHRRPRWTAGLGQDQPGWLLGGDRDREPAGRERRGRRDAAHPGQRGEARRAGLGDDRRPEGRAGSLDHQAGRARGPSWPEVPRGPRARVRRRQPAQPGRRHPAGEQPRRHHRRPVGEGRRPLERRSRRIPGRRHVGDAVGHRLRRRRSRCPANPTPCPGWTTAGW